MNPIAALAIAAGTFSFVLAGLTLIWHPKAVLNRWVALWFVLYGFEACCEALLVTAGDPTTFWWSYRASRVLLALLQPLSVLVPIVFAGIGAKGALVLVGPLAIGSFVETFQTLTGHVFIVGYQTSPWGNLGVVNPDPLWLGLGTALGAYTALANLAILVWAWTHHPARPYRTFLLSYLVLNAVAIAATGLCLALWAGGGFPDVSFVFGAIYIGGVFGLLGHYPFLSDHYPRVDVSLLHTLKTALFILDGRGRIIHASQGAVALLGRSEQKLERKTLGELLGSWPGLSDLEGVSTHGRVPTHPLEGSLGPNRFRLTLTPSHDRFGQVRALYARLDPVDFLDRVGHMFGISSREKEVAALLCEGISTQQIADLLFISVATVKNHLHRLFEKTGTSSRVELVRLLTRDE